MAHASCSSERDAAKSAPTQKKNHASASCGQPSPRGHIRQADYYYDGADTAHNAIPAARRGRQEDARTLLPASCAKRRGHPMQKTRAIHCGPWHCVALAWRPTLATPSHRQRKSKNPYRLMPRTRGTRQPGHMFLRNPCAVWPRFPSPLRATGLQRSAPPNQQLLGPSPRGKGNAESSNEPSRSSCPALQI